MSDQFIDVLFLVGCQKAQTPRNPKVRCLEVIRFRFRRSRREKVVEVSEGDQCRVKAGVLDRLEDPSASVLAGIGVQIFVVLEFQRKKIVRENQVETLRKIFEKRG